MDPGGSADLPPSFGTASARIKGGIPGAPRPAGESPSNPPGLQGKPPTPPGRVLPGSSRSWYEPGPCRSIRVARPTWPFSAATCRRVSAPVARAPKGASPAHRERRAGRSPQRARDPFHPDLYCIVPDGSLSYWAHRCSQTGSVTAPGGMTATFPKLRTGGGHPPGAMPRATFSGGGFLYGFCVRSPWPLDPAMEKPFLAEGLIACEGPVTAGWPTVAAPPRRRPIPRRTSPRTPQVPGPRRS